MKQALLTALKSSWILLCAICYAAGLLIGKHQSPTQKPQTIREFAQHFHGVTKANLLIVSAAHSAGVDDEMELLQTVIPFAVRKRGELEERVRGLESLEEYKFPAGTNIGPVRKNSPFPIGAGSSFVAK